MADIRNIWHVSEYAEFIGGIEQNLFSLASSLKKKGYKQLLLCSNEHGEDEKFLNAFCGCFKTGVGESLDGALKHGIPDVIVVQRPFGKRLLKSLRKIAPVVRVVHDHDLVCPRSHKYFPLTKKICKKPVGISCYRHGCIVGRGNFLGLGFNSVNRRLEDINEHKLLDKIIINSNYMKEELVLNGFDPNMIDVLAPLPASLDIAPKKYPKKSKRVLFVGQIIRGKGPDLLLNAMSKVKSDFELVYIGQGNYMAELEKQVANCGFADKVHLLGNLAHDEVVEQYSQANIVVVPSRWAEPFGMVGIEAMAAARPVVAFRVGGINDWLWHGVNGLAARNGETGLLSSHIEWLLGKPDIAEGLGLSGRKIFEKNYKYSDYILNFERLLSSI